MGTGALRSTVYEHPRFEAGNSLRAKTLMLLQKGQAFTSNETDYAVEHGEAEASVSTLEYGRALHAPGDWTSTELAWGRSFSRRGCSG
jgi:hypothetical protein